MSIPKIIVKGNKRTPTIEAAANDYLELKESYQLDGQVRGLAEAHIVNLENGEILQLQFSDDTSWFCNADTLEDIFPEAIAIKRGPGEDSFVLPNTIENMEVQRGIVGDILLKALNVFVKKKVANEMVDLARDLERKQLENLSGLYSLDKNFILQPFASRESSKPWLLFLHGTSSSTSGSFGELVQTATWDYIHQAYDGQVLAFQHETLSKSPLQNVFELVGKLPQTATLHLISHSRGGLVGDLLARYCNGDESHRGFDVNEIQFLQNEARTEDLKNHEAIVSALSNKKLSIGKFIRVACPASGTTLVGSRMDHFFNMSFNLAGFATGMVLNPIYQSFRSLAASAINYRNDVNVLPGLEAMNPDSPFIKVLNSPQSLIKVDNPLVIISGNCKTTVSFKALLIIAARLFFTKNNDLVVNTAAMYRGAQRSQPVYYFFNETQDTDHFHYFKNKDTQAALLSALKTPEFTLIPEFKTLERGAAGMDRNAILNLDGGQVFSNTVTGTRPIAVVIPGIMGSNLSVENKLVWINYLRFLSGELTRIDIKASDVSAPSLIKTSYEQLVRYLQQSYDVVTIAFDWRLPLNDSAALFKDKMEELMAYKQPIKIIGHSMGGVLVRDFILTQNATWTRLNQSPGFKMIFLGSPLGGSYRIPFVLMGNDVMIDKLSKIDIFHNKKALLGIFSKFPGLLNLLPLSKDNERDFGDKATWDKLAAAIEEDKWPLPLPGDLVNFGNYRDHIINSSDSIDYSNAVYVAGKDKSTPCGYRIDETSNGQELVFLSTGEGDQSVTWETGIPKKMIENKTVYYVNFSHGALSAEPSLFPGLEEILRMGGTNLFTKTRPVVRGSEKVFKTPVQDSYDLTPQALENAVLGITPVEIVSQPGRQMHITISNGDLRYAAYPLLSGHFLNDGITSAESIIDKKLHYALSDRHQLGIYPGEIGTSDYFPSQEPGFNGALIVGLGPLSSFTAYQLTQTVQQAVCKYLLNIDKQNIGNRPIESLGISALVVGSGYGGLSIENAAGRLFRVYKMPMIK